MWLLLAVLVRFGGAATASPRLTSNVKGAVTIFSFSLVPTLNWPQPRRCRASNMALEVHLGRSRPPRARRLPRAGWLCNELARSADDHLVAHRPGTGQRRHRLAIFGDGERQVRLAVGLDRPARVEATVWPSMVLGELSSTASFTAAGRCLDRQRAPARPAGPRWGRVVAGMWLMPAGNVKLSVNVPSF